MFLLQRVEKAPEHTWRRVLFYAVHHVLGVTGAGDLHSLVTVKITVPDVLR